MSTAAQPPIADHEYKSGAALLRHANAAHEGAVQDDCPECQRIQRRMNPPSVFAELYAAACTTDFAPRREDEHRETFFVRMVRAIFNVDETVWDALSEDAQRWYNAAIGRMNSGLPIRDCPGFVEPADTDGRDLTRTIREIVATHPTWPAGEIAQELLRLGWDQRDFKRGTISTVRSVTLDTISVLKKLGMFQERQEAAASASG